MKPRFRITYDIVTQTSTADANYSGFMPRSLGDAPRRNHMPKRPALFTLRQAVEFMQSKGVHIEANESPVKNPRWFTVYPEPDVYGGDSGETYSMHVDSFDLPEISTASRLRIACLLNCYGHRSHP